jgi:hypothetical protein
MRCRIYLALLALTTWVAVACADPTLDSELPWQLVNEAGVVMVPTRDLLPDDGWQQDSASVQADADAFGVAPDCNTPLPRIETDVVEFDTGICGSYTVRVPLAQPLRAGDRVELLVAHTLLSAAEAAEGRLVVRIDGEEVWRWVKSIPEPAAAASPRFVVTRDLPAGTWLGVHVSNHGANNWRLYGIRTWTP